MIIPSAAAMSDAMKIDLGCGVVPAGKAGPAMNSDMVKPVPPSAPAPTNCRLE
jgi:hypothetical protein